MVEGVFGTIEGPYFRPREATRHHPAPDDFDQLVRQFFGSSGTRPVTADAFAPAEEAKPRRVAIEAG